MPKRRLLYVVDLEDPYGWDELIPTNMFCARGQIWEFRRFGKLVRLVVLTPHQIKKLRERKGRLYIYDQNVEWAFLGLLERQVYPKV